MPITTSTISLHHTFMDTHGRTMLTLTAFNLVDDQRDKDLVVCMPLPIFGPFTDNSKITYDYPFTAGFRKPVILTMAAFAIYVVAAALAKVDVRISGKKKV